MCGLGVADVVLFDQLVVQLPSVISAALRVVLQHLKVAVGRS